MINRSTGSLLAFVFFVTLTVTAQTTANNKPLYLDPSQPTDVRVNDLISRMTLEEKASQLVNQSRAIPRLGVPQYDWWSEALHGVANAGTATVFPEPIGLAATFDSPLIHRMAIVIGTEARAKHNQAVKAGRRDIMEGLDFWSPNINIFRDPRWGRGQETYGEDPFLTGRMGVAFVTGLQGDDPKYYRVISTPKHYAVHSGPEPARHSMDVMASKHDMEDTYLPAFRAAIVEGKADSIMCAYNRVNGEPACANTFLLEHTLRNAWNFQGYMVSDCDAVADIERGHHYTKTQAEAAAVSLKLGMDNECADFGRAPDNSDYQKFLDAAKQGLITEQEINTTLTRLFTARMKLGMFDPPEMVKYAQTPESEIDSPEHRQLALQAARESIVLLKNNGVLPLKRSQKRIAVFGPLANQTEVLHGNYAGKASHAVSALEGIRKWFGESNVRYAEGMNFLRQEFLIPTTALTTPDGKPGLKAEYFDNKKYEGTPKVIRIDPTVDLQKRKVWAGADVTAFGPPEGIENGAVRWTGFITPDKSGQYRIGMYANTTRMWFDGKLIVNDPEDHFFGALTVETLTLEKGHHYPIKIEYDGAGFGDRLVWLDLISDPLGDALALAEKSDLAIAVVGITSRLEGEEMKVDVPGFKGGDRTSLDLPKEEEVLLQALKKTGKPLVVVLMNGSALAVNWASQNADAILDAWYSGEEGGTAIAETLAGANNPAGRLPVTFYTGVDQLPDFMDYSMKNRTYRYFTGKPLYPFGYGLSYSKFEFSNLKLSSSALNAGDPLGVDVDVKNVSGPDGDEVVQLYLEFPKIDGAPLRALRAFARVHVKAGATEHVHLDVAPRDLSMVNEAGDRIIASGTHTVVVGGGQPETGVPTVSAKFNVQGEKKLPE